MLFGGKLNRQNCWVVLADIISWDEAEKPYYSLLPSTCGADFVVRTNYREEKPK